MPNRVKAASVNASEEKPVQCWLWNPDKVVVIDFTFEQVLSPPKAGRLAICRPSQVKAGARGVFGVKWISLAHRSRRFLYTRSCVGEKSRRVRFTQGVTSVCRQSRQRAFDLIAFEKDRLRRPGARFLGIAPTFLDTAQVDPGIAGRRIRRRCATPPIA